MAIVVLTRLRFTGSSFYKALKVRAPFRCGVFEDYWIKILAVMSYVLWFSNYEWSCNILKFAFY